MKTRRWSRAVAAALCSVQPGARRIAAVLSLALVLVGLGLVGRQVARIAAWPDELAWRWELENCTTAALVAEHWPGRPPEGELRLCLALSELHPFWHARYPWLPTPTGNRNADMVGTVVVGLLVSLGLGAVPRGLLLLGRWIMEGFSPAGPAAPWAYGSGGAAPRCHPKALL